MTLRLLKPTLNYLRSALPSVPRHAPAQVVERLRGSALIAMRHRVLARSGGLCECPECIGGFAKPITWDTFELDHVVRIADGGTNALTNLRAVHWQCHARITARQNAEVAMYGTVLDDPPPPLVRRLPGQDADDFPC